MAFMKTDIIYRQLAWFYDLTFKVLLEEGHIKTQEKLQSEKTGKQVLKVAELGIGPGHSFPHYPSGTELWGIDVSEDMVKMAQKRASDYPNIDFHLSVMDAMNTTLPSESFDMVISFSVITVVDSPEKLLQEACRLCRPGGKIIIVGRLKRPGVFDLLWRNVTNRLTLFLFGFKMTLDEKVYDAIASQVKIVEHRKINHVGPFALSDMMVLEKSNTLEG